LEPKGHPSIPNESNQKPSYHHVILSEVSDAKRQTRSRRTPISLSRADSYKETSTSTIRLSPIGTQHRFNNHNFNHNKNVRSKVPSQNFCKFILDRKQACK